MLDITSPKIALPSALFLILSPGMFLQIPDKIPGRDTNAIMTGKTSKKSVVVHAIVFALAYYFIAKQMGIVLVPNDIIVPTILFLLLNPGMFFSLYAGQSYISSVLMHTLIFAVVFAFLRKTFPKYY